MKILVNCKVIDAEIPLYVEIIIAVLLLIYSKSAMHSIIGAFP